MTNTLCCSLARLVPLLIAPTLLGSPTTQPFHRDGPFLIGADISWVQEDEANGAVYYDRVANRRTFSASSKTTASTPSASACLSTPEDYRVSP